VTWWSAEEIGAHWGMFKLPPASLTEQIDRVISETIRTTLKPGLYVTHAKGRPLCIDEHA
jgi:hypothetical protein